MTVGINRAAPIAGALTSVLWCGTAAAHVLVSDASHAHFADGIVHPFNDGIHIGTILFISVLVRIAPAQERFPLAAAFWATMACGAFLGGGSSAVCYALPFVSFAMALTCRMPLWACAAASALTSFMFIFGREHSDLSAIALAGLLTSSAMLQVGALGVARWVESWLRSAGDQTALRTAE